MPTQGEGFLAASAAAHAREEAAARARAAEQMAFEDAWKATNPDFTTPFASVEDAVSRLLPYHVFADYEEEEDCVDGGGATATEKSSAQEWEEVIDAETKDLTAHFEKQVLTFNIINRERAEGIARGEERLMLEMALYDDERRQAERVRAAIVQEHRELQEAARKRLALAQAQAAGAWPLVQPSAAWQALEAAAAASGQGGSGGQALVQALVMQQQQEMMTSGTWQELAAAASRGDGGAGGQALVQAVMMQHMQQQQQQQKQKMIAAASRGEGATGGQALTPAVVMQQQHQEEEMMGYGAWRLQQLGGRQAYVAPCADGSSSGQAAATPQQPAQEQASGAATGMMMPLPWRGSAERREQ